MNEADYIVVGAGAAGCVVARRLIDRTPARVLLVEAGPGYRGVIHNPPLPGLRLGRRFSWAQQSIPQVRLQNRRIEWPMGKVVGGSSTINAMIAYLGHPSNYDSWEAQGNPGWSADALAPYFERAFGLRPGVALSKANAGMISLSAARHRSPFSEAFLEACEQDGMVRESSLRGTDGDRCGYYPVLQRNGERFESARGYLQPAIPESRLALRTSVPVLRVLFAGDRAVGIETLENGVRQQTYASAGVILCAGAFQTPRILQCSGLGPAGVLESAGIAPRIDLPAIGANLQDHVRVEMVFRTSRLSPGSKRRWLPEALRYLGQRQGVMTSNCCETGAFLCSGPEVQVPDLQLITHFQTFGLKRHVAVEVCLVAPHSRGRVDLCPEDPFGKPRVDPNYFDDPRDLEALRAGIERVRSIADRPSLRGFPLFEEVRPGRQGRGTEALSAAISRLALTAYHPGGSCAMGPQGALDSNLRVRGTRTLWVADASAMPTVPFGNSTCPVIVLAEKASDLILAAPH